MPLRRVVYIGNSYKRLQAAVAQELMRAKQMNVFAVQKVSKNERQLCVNNAWNSVVSMLSCT